MNESERRKNLDFTDVEALSQKINIRPYSSIIHGEHFFYRFGMDVTLKKYANIPLNNYIHAFLEHGIVLTDHIGGSFKSDEYLPTIVLSKFRADVLGSQENSKEVYPIGPYIHYAKTILSEEKLKEEKEELGKTLLVMPSHSITNVHTNFDYKKFIENIHKVAKDYDTVRVCMFWGDVVLERHIPYLKEGFQVVTAGHANDYYFLPRLKSYIENSDMTMSNDIGSHLGYCVYLGKPHFLSRTDITYDITSKNKTLIRNIMEPRKKLEASDNFLRISELFSQYDTQISKDQYELIGYLWGFDEVKTPKELNDLISKINSSYSTIGYWRAMIRHPKNYI